jgi:hypothetical protein
MMVGLAVIVILKICIGLNAETRLFQLKVCNDGSYGDECDKHVNSSNG